MGYRATVSIETGEEVDKNRERVQRALAGVLMRDPVSDLGGETEQWGPMSEIN